MDNCDLLFTKRVIREHKEKERPGNPSGWKELLCLWLRATKSGTKVAANNRNLELQLPQVNLTLLLLFPVLFLAYFLAFFSIRSFSSSDDRRSTPQSVIAKFYRAQGRASDLDIPSEKEGRCRNLLKRASASGLL